MPTTSGTAERYTIKRGTTFAIDFVALRPDTGATIDLTAATVVFRARRGFNDDEVFELTVGSGIEVTDATGGCATATLGPTDTSAIENLPTDLVYDVHVTVGSDVWVVTSGVLVVEPTTDI